VGTVAHRPGDRRVDGRKARALHHRGPDDRYPETMVILGFVVAVVILVRT
jgi:hypothetical protein